MHRLPAVAAVALILLAVPAMASLLTTSLDRDHPKAFALLDEGRLHSMTSESGVLFETFIHFQENGESFLYASTPPEGSGAFLTEAVFWIAPDNTIHPVAFENAGETYQNKVREGEFILTGGPGIIFANDGLQFEFQIANKGDFSCCPTAGKMRGTYKLVGEKRFDRVLKEYSCTFKLVVDRYETDTVSPDQSSGHGSEE